MSHFCTMHHPPLSSKWTGKDHEGERTTWRLAHPSCPFKAPTTPQNHARGTTLRRAPSTSLPSFSKRKSSLFSTLKADVGEATHVRRILWQDGLVSGRCIVLGESDHRSEDRSVCLLQSALQMEPQLEACSPHKGFDIQVIASKFNLALFYVALMSKEARI